MEEGSDPEEFSGEEEEDLVRSAGLSGKVSVLCYVIHGIRLDYLTIQEIVSQ